LERLVKVILFGTLATTVPLHNISTLCNRNEKYKTKCIIFRKAQRAACKGSWAACGSRAAVWPPLL